MNRDEADLVVKRGVSDPAGGSFWRVIKSRSTADLQVGMSLSERSLRDRVAISASTGRGVKVLRLDQRDEEISFREEGARKTWGSYFMDIARAVSTRSTCDRRHVGCVLVRDRMILSTGYNGSVRGAPHCDDVGHLMEDGHCVRTVHAESNAVAQAARAGVRVDGATAYVTSTPCWPCFRLLANAGVVRVVSGSEYRPDPKVAEAAKLVGIELESPAPSPTT